LVGSGETCRYRSRFEQVQGVRLVVQYTGRRNLRDGLQVFPAGQSSPQNGLREERTRSKTHAEPEDNCAAIAHR
jgi:hypothetical protein